MQSGEVKDKVKVVQKEVELLAEGKATSHFEAAKFIGQTEASPSNFSDNEGHHHIDAF